MNGHGAPTIQRQRYGTLKAKIRHGFPVVTKLMRVLTMGPGEQNFIGAKFIRTCFLLAPASSQRALALRIAAISPHYFSRQWSYPIEMRRASVLEAEHERLVSSRRLIGDRLLRPRLKPNMTVLDFGCGPGYLTGQVAPQVKLIYGVDISEGALLCARELNGGPNINYLRVEQPPTSIQAGAVDFIYTFAVVQHMSVDQIACWFKEFHRILNPESGTVLCQTHLSDDRTSEDILRSASNPEGSSRFLLRFQFRSSEEMARLATVAGFRTTQFLPVAHAFDSKNDDDIAHGQILILRP